MQKEDPDIGVIYRWVVTRKKPKNMQRHVNSFIKTHGKNIQLVNDELVVKAQRHGRDIVQAMIPQSDTPRILQLLHHQSGHFGVAKTQYNVGTRFFWFKWKRDVQDWCRSCKTCLQRKGVHKRDLPPVGQLPIPRQPFQCWHMDFVGPLPKTPGEIGLSFLLRILSASGSRLFQYPTKQQQPPLKYCCGKLFVDMVLRTSYTQTKVKTLNHNYYKNSIPLV